MTRTWSTSGSSETELTLSTLGSILYPLQFHSHTIEVLATWNQMSCLSSSWRRMVQGMDLYPFFLPPPSVLPSTSMVGTQSWESKVCYWMVGWPQCLPSRSPVCSFGSKIWRSAVSPCLKVCLVSNEQQLFWCPTVDEDTWDFVKACSDCSQHKSSHQAPSGLLKPLPICHWRWSHISLDFVTGAYSGGLPGKWLIVKRCHFLHGMLAHNLSGHFQ